jgi:hypothetical protein
LNILIKKATEFPESEKPGDVLASHLGALAAGLNKIDDGATTNSAESDEHRGAQRVRAIPSRPLQNEPCNDGLALGR